MDRAVFRPLRAGDLADVLALYADLAAGGAIAEGLQAEAIFAQLLALPGTTIFGADLDGRIASVATLHLLPNLTRAGRPYALVENVVTLTGWRGQGLARGVMEKLVAAAWAAGAYKIMLLTGKTQGAAGFYRKLGFDADEKHGMTLRRL